MRDVIFVICQFCVWYFVCLPTVPSSRQ